MMAVVEAKAFIEEIRNMLHKMMWMESLIISEGDCERIIYGLDQVIAVLEQTGMREAETFANHALRLIQKANPKMTPSSVKDIDPHEYQGFIRGFDRIQTQIFELVCRYAGMSRSPVVGVEEEVQLAISRLISGNLARRVVSITGIKGIGKTTLATKVYEHSFLIYHFPIRVWVAVSLEFDPTSFQLKVAKELRCRDEIDPVKKISWVQYWLSRRRYLIVLDDVHTREAWNIIEKLLPDSSNGSAIMITSRCRNLVDAGARCYTLEKQALSDAEGLELFNARVGFHIPAELEEIGRLIVKKCRGLPVDISALGYTLSNTRANLEQWSMVLQNIDNDQLSQYLPLGMVANELPSNWQQCLFYFGFFREDYDVPARRLISYWVAEELLTQEIGLRETPEYVAQKILMELVRQNLIVVAKWKLNGKVKTCRMNYLLRNNWLSKAKQANFLVVNSQESVSKSSHRSGMVLRLADQLDKEADCFHHIHGNDTIRSSSLKYFYRDLHSFLSFDSREGSLPGEAIGNFFRKCIAAGCFKLLRILDLEGVFRPNLPNSIGKLVQLRYLGLRWTYIKTLPSSIGSLHNLQTLDLKHTCISSLDSSLWKLRQLRHLYLSENYRSKFVPPPSTNTLIDIQTLWGAYVNEETPIKDVLDRLINVRKLGLTCQLTLSQQKPLAKWIIKLKHLESLRLRSIGKMAKASNIYLEPLSGLKNLSSIYLCGRLENPVIVHDFPKSLTEVTLSISGLIEDPMPSLGKLPNLRILGLLASSYSGKIMVCPSGGFPLLRVLNLWKLEVLEEWMLEEGALPILKEVEIRSCNKLKMIPDGVKQLHYCRELKITHMPDEFKARVIENHGKDWYKIAHIPSIIIKD